MRQLMAADSDLSPQRALDHLQCLQHHRIRINPSTTPINGISRPSQTHHRVFAALNLKNPAWKPAWLGGSASRKTALLASNC
jgi:hypothetical protein